MKATEALEMQADLFARVSDFRLQAAMKHHLALDSVDNYDQALRLSTEIVADLPSKVRDAETFFVGSEMCELVRHSANVLDSTDVADVKSPPSRSGFIYFEKPIPMQDVRGQELLVNAMVWYPVRGGLLLHFWNDQRRTPDDAAKDFASLPEEMIRSAGRWGYIGISLYEDEQQIGDIMIAASEATVAKYGAEGIEPLPVSNPKRIAHAFWLLLQQKIVMRSIERGDRKLTKRLLRAGVPGEVTVIALRHVEYPEGEGEGQVYWRHRWIVRGFWRWQPYKDETGEWARKRIWIDPYVKGPAGAPLKISKKVNAVVR